MANRVYDDQIEEATKDGTIRPDDQIRELEKSYNSPSAERSGSDIAAERADEDTPRETEGAEKPDDNTPTGKSKADKAEKSKLDKQIGSGFKDEKVKGKTSSKSASKSRKKQIIGGVGGLGLVTILGVLTAAMLLLSTLKIPHLMQNIETLEFARLSRNFAKSSGDLIGEKMTLDSSDVAGVGLAEELATKYGKDIGQRSALWTKIDQWRPEKVLSKLKSEGNFTYQVEQKSGRIFGGVKSTVTGVTIGGEFISKGGGRWFNLIERRAGRLNFAGELQGRLEVALKNSNTLVRGAVAKDIRERLGIKLRRWERLTPTYQDAKARGIAQAEAAEARAAAEAKALQQTLADTKTTPTLDANLPPIQDATDAALALQEDCLKNIKCTEEIINDGGKSLAKRSQIAINNALKNSFAEEILDTLGGINKIILPLCIIDEGSVQKSAPVAIANSDRAKKTFYGYSSAWSQQKAGLVGSQEVDALNRQVGNISSAPSERKASGQMVHNSENTNPEAAGGGSFTVVDAIFGDNSIIAPIWDFMSDHCHLITDWKTQAGLIGADWAVKIILTLTTGGGGVTEGAAVAAAEATVEQVTEVAIKKSFIQRIRNLLVKEAVFAAGISGTTLFSRMLVMSRMGNTVGPVASPEELVTQADQGGNLVANDLNRKQQYGRPLTGREVTESNYQDLQDIAFQNSQKSVFEKYFSPTNPTSVLANMAISLNPSFTQSLVTSLGDLFTSLGSIFHPSSSMFVSLLTGTQHKALAASADYNNYGITQIGWSADEESVITAHPEEFSPINNAQWFENAKYHTQAQRDAIEERWDACFSSEMGDLFRDEKIKRDQTTGTVDENDGQCSPHNLGPNAKTGDGGSEEDGEAFQYRLYMRYKNTLDHNTEIANAQPAAP